MRDLEPSTAFVRIAVRFTRYLETRIKAVSSNTCNLSCENLLPLSCSNKMRHTLPKINKTCKHRSQ